MKVETVVFFGFVVFALYEILTIGQTEGAATATPLLSTPVGTVPNNPSTANALGTPNTPISASTLSPAQLGGGLFEDPSGLQQTITQQTGAPQQELLRTISPVTTNGSAY